MSHDFRTLSPADFEDLVRDLVGADRGIRFEAFAPGPDGGIDGRHACGARTTVLQAKHHPGSARTRLEGSMRKEKPKIDRLTPTEYLLATSCSLSDEAKRSIAAIVAPHMRSSGDIYGAEDLNGLLRTHPDIEKAHLKLWLTRTSVLEGILNSAARTYGALTREEIGRKVLVFVPNASMTEALDRLENEHVLIVHGPPGVGKTTLAEMVCWTHLAEDWDIVVVRDIDEALGSFDERRRQIFYFDDFLGRIDLDRMGLARMDSVFARFVAKVRRSENTRFVLTTRTPILEEARQRSEHLDGPGLALGRYLLDVNRYTRRIKALILYNHLVASTLPETYRTALVTSGRVGHIIDHPHYNPRVVVRMTDAEAIRDVTVDRYAEAFVAMLDHPDELWDKPFRLHIPPACRHLLLTLFFCAEVGVGIDELRTRYEHYHRALSERYNLPRDPKDFETSLRILENGFVAIRGRSVWFVNPSLKDYLKRYLVDLPLLLDAAGVPGGTRWAASVWQHANDLFGRGAIDRSSLRELAISFETTAQSFLSQPVHRISGTDGSPFLTLDGLTNSERVRLLLEWARHAGGIFPSLARRICLSPMGGWSSVWEGSDLVGLVASFPRDAEGLMPDADALASHLEQELIDRIESGSLDTSTLLSFAAIAKERQDDLPSRVLSALDQAIVDTFQDYHDVLAAITSISELDDYIGDLDELANHASISDFTLKIALAASEERRFQLSGDDDERSTVVTRPVVSDREGPFDDASLRALFNTLLH